MCQHQRSVRKESEILLTAPPSLKKKRERPLAVLVESGQFMKSHAQTEKSSVCRDEMSRLLFNCSSREALFIAEGTSPSGTSSGSFGLLPRHFGDRVFLLFKDLLLLSVDQLTSVQSLRKAPPPG